MLDMLDKIDMLDKLDKLDIDLTPAYRQAGPTPLPSERGADSVIAPLRALREI